MFDVRKSSEEADKFETEKLLSGSNSKYKVVRYDLFICGLLYLSLLSQEIEKIKQKNCSMILNI